MSSGTHYAPISGGHDVQDFEALEFHDAIMRPSEEVEEEEEGTRLSSTSSVSELDMNTQDTPANAEPPPEFRALTLLDNAPDAKTRPEWQDPVRWCLWGNIAVLVINILFTIAAVGVSASKYGSLSFGSISLYQGSCSTTQEMKIGLHLLINVLGVTMTATSSYCCAILMAPSRTDVDKAHSKGTWLSIGVSSWRNFRNLRKSSQALWSLLLLTSIIMQMVYNSVVYSSLNANSYPVIVAPLDFVSNSSVPTSFFEEQSCFPEDILNWNITNLRSSILNGSFEYLSKDECTKAYAKSYTSDRRTVVAVTHEPMTGEGISLAGYGYAGGIAAANPTKTILDKKNYKDLFVTVDNWDPLGFEWMCYVKATDDGGCSSAFLQDLGYWNVSALGWPLMTSVHIPHIPESVASWINKYGILEMGESRIEDALLERKLDWTRKDVEAFLSYVQTNPLPQQMWAYLNSTSWIASAEPGVNVSASCPTMSELYLDELYLDEWVRGPLQTINVDHCLSQKTPEECRLFYHLPIALVMIICNLIKVVCIWLLLRINRRDLFLTIGDAISSFLQRPDPTTKQWCTLSPEVITRDQNCPWHARNKGSENEKLWSQEPHPGVLRRTIKSWSKASSGMIWGLTYLVLLLYIVLSLILPVYAVQNTTTHQLSLYQGEVPLFAIWQIKGWGTVQSTALLSNFATSFVGMELLANTPQLAVSLLYFCFNDTLTRMILAADYNNFAIHRRPLRVTFPRGEQRSTWYLTIPYQYAVPLLTTFTLTHWFISEGLFYVQVLPYNLYGKPILSASLVTCGVSTIPLELGLFLMVGVFVVVSLLGARRFNVSKMPLAFEWSVVISAACHPSHLDLDAAFKPVQWGEVKAGIDAPYPRCSFTSKEVKEPENDIQYA